MCISRIIHSTNESHDDVIRIMSDFLEDDDFKVQVGIFWLIPSTMTLFGVQKQDAELCDNGASKYTYPKLHKTYWQKQHHRAVAKKDTKSIFYNEHDYTKIPRGRIFIENDEPVVYVGEWINDIDLEQFTELLEDEFNLPTGFKYVIDEHWNLGRGWSEEKF